jgi:hypothetical protein
MKQFTKIALFDQVRWDAALPASYQGEEFPCNSLHRLGSDSRSNYLRRAPKSDEIRPDKPGDDNPGVIQIGRDPLLAQPRGYKLRQENSIRRICSV